MLQTIALRLVVGAQSFTDNLRSDERGQDTLEWAMLGGLVALGILGVTALMTGALTDMVTGISNCIDFDATSVCNAGF